MSHGALIDVHKVETWAPEPERSADSTPTDWKKLYRTGALAALAIVVLVPLQIVVFVVWPPPATVSGTAYIVGYFLSGLAVVGVTGLVLAFASLVPTGRVDARGLVWLDRGE